MPSTRRKPEPGPAERLHAFAAGLGLPLLGESSLRLTRGRAQADRYLLSVPAQLSAAQLEALATLTAELGLPPALFATLAADLPEAINLHFGFEGHDTLKLYCEFPLTAWDAARDRGERLLVHRAIKWSPADPSRAATSRYLARPAQSVREAAARLTALLGDNAAGQLALQLFHRAAGRIGARDRLLLEVEEDNSPRRSFDLKLYDAGFTTADLTTALPGLAAFFDLPGIQIPAASLGHIAGGQGRDGQPFLTLYYGGGQA